LTARRKLNDFNKELEEMERKNNEDKIARKIKQLEERKARKENRKNKKEAEQKELQQKQTSEQKRREEAQRPIAVGDCVRIKGQSATGKVMECNGRTAIVTFGMMKTNVEVARLEHASEPPREKNAAAMGTMFVSRETQDNMYEKKLQFKPDIDVRGMRGDEAINAVTYFIDDAILLGMNRVRILHGTGTGALRTLIRQYLSTVGGVADFRDEHVQFGGAGITVVDLL
jgi:DNA mismatch repair protein MutS2